MININMFVLDVFAKWMELCTWFSAYAFLFGIVYFAVAFLIKAQITLEGKIRNEKVWREALKLYVEKHKLNVELKEEENDNEKTNS